MIRININKLVNDQKLMQKLFADLDEGAVCVIPTDTLYGFAVSSNSVKAVSKVYKIKNRSSLKPLILFADCIERLKKIGVVIPEKVGKKLRNLWPGALTAIFKTPENEIISAFTYPTIGTRIPAQECLLRILSGYSGLLLTTSANRSNEPSVSDPHMIADEFDGEIDWLIDDGKLAETLPSTIVDFTKTEPVIIRKGELAINTNDFL